MVHNASSHIILVYVFSGFFERQKDRQTDRETKKDIESCMVVHVYNLNYLGDDLKFKAGLDNLVIPPLKIKFNRNPGQVRRLSSKGTCCQT